MRELKLKRFSVQNHYHFNQKRHFFPPCLIWHPNSEMIMPQSRMTIWEKLIERQQLGGKQKPMRPSNGGFWPWMQLLTIDASRFTVFQTTKFSVPLPSVVLFDSAIENCRLSLSGPQHTFMLLQRNDTGEMERIQRQTEWQKGTQRQRGALQQACKWMDPEWALAEINKTTVAPTQEAD